MELPKRVLFICTGNACRSVMAELLLKKASAERGLGLEVRSCGTAAERGFAVPAGVRSALSPEGISGFSHVPQLVGRELLAWSGLALAMTRAHREHVLDRFPEFRSKVFVLRAYAGLSPEDIEDPIGRPDEDFAACRDLIKEALEALVNAGRSP